jgi:hypothetical protein
MIFDRELAICGIDFLVCCVGDNTQEIVGIHSSVRLELVLWGKRSIFGNLLMSCDSVKIPLEQGFYESRSECHKNKLG